MFGPEKIQVFNQPSKLNWVLLQKKKKVESKLYNFQTCLFTHSPSYWLYCIPKIILVNYIYLDWIYQIQKILILLHVPTKFKQKESTDNIWANISRRELFKIFLSPNGQKRNCMQQGKKEKEKRAKNIMGSVYMLSFQLFLHFPLYREIHTHFSSFF